MTGVFFLGAALVCSMIAAFIMDLRRAVLALWGAGFFCGLAFLSGGNEMLAVIQWLVSTVSAMSFLVFSIMMGSRESAESGLKARILPVIFFALFSALIVLGTANPPRDVGSLVSSASPQSPSPQSLQALGQALLSRHLVSFEVLGLIFLLVLVAGGVVARKEPEEHSGEGSSRVGLC